jgi:regulator of sigma E protease
LDGKGVVVGLERAGKDMEVTVQPILQLKDDVNWLKDGSLIRGLLVTKEGGKAQIQSTDGKMVELPEDQIASGAGMEQLDILGMVPRLMVVLVENDSPADKAGLRPGDIIVGYGDQSAPTLHQFHQLNKQFQGKGTNITIRRDGQEKKCWVVPAARKENVRVGVTQGLDLMHPVVAGIRDGSAAQHAGFEPESVIQTVNGQEVDSWIDVFEALRKAAGQEVMITYRVGEREKTANLGVLEKGQFDPGLYEFTLFGSDVAFHMMEVKLVERDPVKALVWGGQETGKLILSTYLSLRRIGQGTVSTKSLAGPVGIGSIAIQVGRKSLIDFIYFLAFISASLAVINFLPIPVVDGGHAVFLLIEKIRGKPLPAKVLYYAQMAGLALIVAVFVALTWQDISRIVRGMW